MSRTIYHYQDQPHTLTELAFKADHKRLMYTGKGYAFNLVMANPTSTTAMPTYTISERQFTSKALAHLPDCTPSAVLYAYLDDKIKRAVKALPTDMDATALKKRQALRNFHNSDFQVNKKTSVRVTELARIARDVFNLRIPAFIQ